jgi:ketosteroid isomerase-like protein
MRRSAILLALLLVTSTPSQAAPADDAGRAVTALIDRFNAGDVEAFLAGHADDAVIVDEFAPYLWSGTGSVQRWVSDYGKDAGAKDIKAGRIDYAAPVQAMSDGDGAYIVLPTTYRFTQQGRKMAGKGSMTFVMKRVGPDWKIASWTYSGATPVPE